jgi:hypothetical protein
MRRRRVLAVTASRSPVECNSTAGHQLDSHLRPLEDDFDFATGNLTTPVKGTFKVGNGEMAATLTRTGHVTVSGLPENTDPTQHDALVEHFNRLVDTGLGEGESMTWSFRSRWTDANVRASWLRAAYLIAFAALGYRYILRTELEPVRAQVNDPAGPHAPRAVMVNPRLPKTHRALWLVERPKTLRSVNVGMGRWAVWLPGLGIDPTFYERLAARKVWPPRIKTVSGKRVVWPTEPRLDLAWELS